MRGSRWTARRIATWAAGLLLGLPLALAVLAIAALLAAGNLDPGRRALESLAVRATGGMIRIEGLEGRFPDHLRIARLSVADAAGPWLVVDRAALDWSPLALLHGVAHVERLAAAQVSAARLPQARPAPAKPPAKPGGGFSLPVRIRLDKLDLPAIRLAPPVVGLPVAVAAEGSARVDSLQDGQAALALRSLTDASAYRLQGRIDKRGIDAALRGDEPEHGLAATLAKLPALGGPVAIDLALAGPYNAEALRLAFAAGKLSAHATGTLDLPARVAALDVAANAPAMAPRADLAWDSIALDAHLRGAFARPGAKGSLQVSGLQAGGAGVKSLSARFDGDAAGLVALRAQLDGLRLPGPKPDLLADAPLALRVEAHLDRADRPVSFALDHTLLHLVGDARTAGPLAGHATLDLPALAPLAAIGGVALEGHAHAAASLDTQGPTTVVGIDGGIGITGGRSPVPALVGPDAHLHARAALRGQDFTVREATLDGAALHLDAKGSDRAGTLDFDWHVKLPSLSALAAQLTGALAMQGHVGGAPPAFAFDAALRGRIGANGIRPGEIDAALHADGLPGQPRATLALHGKLDGAPLALDAALDRQNGAAHLALSKLEWKHARGAADLTLPAGARVPLGRARLALDLADLRPFVPVPIGGTVQATIDGEAGARPRERIALRIAHAGVPSAQVGRATLDARIDDPAGAPSIAAKLDAEGIEAGGVRGAGTMEADGKLPALALKLDAAVAELMGAGARLSGAATLDLPGHAIRLSRLAADWHGESLRLLAPARIGFGAQTGIDRLRLALNDAVLEASGTIKPRLDLTASLRGVTPALAEPFAPTLKANGSMTADAHLTGTLAAPAGAIRLAATGLRLREGPARGLPPASLRAEAQLRGKAAALDANLALGASRLRVAGDLPLDQAGSLGLRATGQLDLAMLDPILTAAGRRVLGTVAIDLVANGPASHPRLGGEVRLADGEFQDLVQGVHLSAMTATLRAENDRVRIAGFRALAGPGSITADGTVGVLQPGIPVALAIRARNAQPLAADRLTATVDMDLAVRGAARQRIAASGRVQVRRATINIPDHLPGSVAVLDVRLAGAPPPPPPAPGPQVALDLQLDAPGDAIFVRGHGLDAVLGGRLHVAGDAKSPEVSGGFSMRHGTFSLAGTTLNFVRGRVGFAGTGVTGKIDPTLDFEADSTAGGVTAKLLVGGYASAPKLSLASVPQLPQDEVLAHLLFGTGTTQLGPFQIAAIAEALASITGVAGDGPSPLERVRKGLGLDRLSVGKDNGNSIANTIPDLDQRRSANDSQTSVQAGRYIANGVYVGAKQGTSGADTQAQVQIDITKRLKAETDLGSGRGANNLGLTYQFEY